MRIAIAGTSAVAIFAVTLLHSAASAQDVGTFNGFRGRTDGGKIDYVLVDSRWQVEGAEILRDNDEGRYPSDHFPVVADLVLGEGPR